MPNDIQRAWARALRAFALLVCVSVAGLVEARPARADGKADARALYDQGAAAFNAGDYPRAASLLADADALAPNPMVLELALGASLRADDAVLGEDLALRLDARRGSAAATELSTRVHDRFRSRVGRVRIVCRENRPCAAHLGSMRWLGGELHAVAPGIVDVVFDESASHVRIDVRAGSVADLLEPLRPAPDAVPPPVQDTPKHAGSLGETAVSPGGQPRTGGLPGRVVPVVAFWVGAALTASLTAATIGSGIDTQARRDDFLASRTLANQSAGESAVTRTNVLLASTLIAAGATAVLGVLFTRWRSSPGSLGGHPRTPGAAASLTRAGALVW
jgi:hypothetical protein